MIISLLESTLIHLNLGAHGRSVLKVLLWASLHNLKVSKEYFSFLFASDCLNEEKHTWSTFNFKPQTRMFEEWPFMCSIKGVCRGEVPFGGVLQDTYPTYIVSQPLNVA